MKQFTTNTCFLATIFMSLLVSCNETATSPMPSDDDTTTVAGTSNASPALPSYDPAMDPLTTGGQMTKKMADTLGVKMYEFTVKPGQSWGVHTHPDHTVYVIEGGKMALYMGTAGKTDTLTFPTGMAFVSGPLTDSGKNIGKTTIKMLVTDLYRARQQ